VRWQEWVWFHTRPPIDARRDEHGRCNVCGERARFLYSRWSIPPRMLRDLGDDALRDAYRRRESMWCSVCGASRRERGYWDVLLEHYGQHVRSARELATDPAFGDLAIAEINRLNAGHEFLQVADNVVYSEYPDEDIQALSYADGAFDLVLTSETLEHVPDYRTALRETRRILRPGGRHVMTVPLRPDLQTTRDRAGLPPVYHGEPPGPLALIRRPTDDMRCLHDFAWDFLDEVEAAGFEVERHGHGIETVICAIAR